MATADDLDAGLKREVAALGAALDQVQRTCGDYCGPFPRLDRELDDLLRAVALLTRQFLEAALRFRAADSSTVWPEAGMPFAPSFGDFWQQARPYSTPPLPLAWLTLLASGPPPREKDLRELGDTLLGFGSWATSAVATFGQLANTPLSILSAPHSDWIGEQLARSAPGRRVLSGLSKLEAAPLTGAAQASLTTLTALEDANRLKRDGNPLAAWRRKGAGYVADLAGAGFDVSSTMCANAPSWATCGTAAATGTVWAAAETWQHREGLVHGADLAARFVVDEARRVRGLASHALDEAGSAQERLFDAIRDPDRNPGLVRFPPAVTHAIAHTVERAADTAAAAVNGTQRVVSSGWRWVTG